MEPIKIKITKLLERPDAEHPNNIQEQEYRVGYMNDLPKVGDCFWVSKISIINGMPAERALFRTSTVEEVEELNILKDSKTLKFKTLNSIYQIELL